ncbi:MAG: pleiotropic regulatory protein [Microgenomates group bacterium GW2011_GWC1_41_8]|uniref:Glutamine-scyllo-inositol transaminase n=2 Tax=Candidatus Roizmaniibacteriota TaxID=1752723 RepID=A0A0G0T4K9_9BACT|nr:MAG: Glutamine-scyllo-inositol transaminase [Candidatus Roizmanbacteria bacterium GW2011_GWB1_40_7]KKR94718.1 MAG: Glutamine-scyllo-inositol transaminase [Candidatus Roizmanbacteria bacterium GW2011_GWA1_41_13]KKS24701.1 MAG: pleiotropic regulatory protein [Microgenomates group bacterium GW2011_GWC1_41_8]OGK50031.1 MAG: hypothetical protein A3A55_03660 [Candidatus Roizmanbacteria bacterium RIFCSPLOWO2_01_FULL_40_14]
MKRTIAFNALPESIINAQSKLLNKCKKIFSSSGNYLYGRENKQFERNLKRYFKTKYALTLASGHDGLLLSLNSLHLTKYDEVIFPVNAYPTAFPVLLSGAKPVPADIDENGQLSIPDVISKITNKTKVIITVYLYGLTGNLDQLLKVVKEYDTILLEDCAQAFGTHYKGKPVGTFGNAGCFSFYPTKNLGTLGDGGAVITNNIDLHTYLLQAKAYGEQRRYKSAFISGHSRLPELQAGILNVFFENFTSVMRKKKQLYRAYMNVFERSNISDVMILRSDPYSDPMPHLFVIRAAKRNKLKQYLQKKCIPTLIHYPYPIHKVRAFQTSIYTKRNFPAAERFSKEILSLPFHEYLAENDIEYIVKSIKAFYA